MPTQRGDFLTEALKTLDSTLLERVGTKTSTTRPLNKINNILSELEQKRQRLMRKQQFYGNCLICKQNSILNELNAKLDSIIQTKESVIASRLLSLQKELENHISQRSRIEESLEESNNNISKLKNYENISAETVSEITMLLREEKQVEEMLLLEQTRLAEFQEKCDELSDLLEPDELFEKKVEDVQAAINTYNEVKERHESKHLPAT